MHVSLDKHMGDVKHISVHKPYAHDERWTLPCMARRARMRLAGRCILAALAALFTAWLCLQHAENPRRVATEAGPEDARKQEAAAHAVSAQAVAALISQHRLITELTFTAAQCRTR